MSHVWLGEAGVDLYTALKPSVEAVPLAANLHLSDPDQAAFCTRLKQLADALPDAELNG